VLASVARADDVPPEAVIATIPFAGDPRSDGLLLDLKAGGESCKVGLVTSWALSVGSKSAEHAIEAVLPRVSGLGILRLDRDGAGIFHPVPAFYAAASDDCVGLVGGKLVRDYVLDLDFRARVALLLDPARFQVPESTQRPEEAVVPVRIVEDRPVVEIRINGHPLEVLVDTGLANPLLLSVEAVKRLGISVDRLPPAGEFLGAPARRLESAEAEIGRLRFDSVPAIVPARESYHPGKLRFWVTSGPKPPDASAIGCGLLSSAHVRIDYPRSRMWLRREALGATAGTTHAQGGPP